MTAIQYVLPLLLTVQSPLTDPQLPKTWSVTVPSPLTDHHLPNKRSAPSSAVDHRPSIHIAGCPMTTMLWRSRLTWNMVEDMRALSQSLKSTQEELSIVQKDLSTAKSFVSPLPLLLIHVTSMSKLSVPPWKALNCRVRIHLSHYQLLASFESEDSKKGSL